MTLPKARATTPRERFVQLISNLDLIKANLPDDTDRIELDTLVARGATRAAYIRAKLARDGHTQELAAIERKEITPHAVAAQ
jgi:hypothetical protein